MPAPESGRPREMTRAQRLAAARAEQFTPIPPTRIMPASPPPTWAPPPPPLTLQQEHRLAITMGIALGDTPAEYARRLRILVAA